MPEAYPLEWPPGWPRTPEGDRQYGRFGTMTGPHRSRRDITIAEAVRRLRGEVDRMGGSSLVVSSDVPVRQDGLPYSNRRAPDDPGVAVYFRREGEPVCMPCDRYTAVADNIAAVAKAIEALRGLERWGSGQMLRAAFMGFKALPVRASGVPWYETLGVGPTAPRSEIDKAYRRLASIWHPDRPEGDQEKFQEISEARRQGLDVAGGS